MWTFKLRRGVKFHGGQPLRSADVKYSFERILKVSPRKTDYQMIKEIRTPDDSTVQFVLSARSNAFFSALAMYWAQVVEAASTEKQVKETGGVVTPNCTGPFKVAEYRRGQSLKLVHVVLAFLSSGIFELVIGPLLPSVVVQFDLWGLGLVCTLPRTASWISRAAEEVQLAFLRRYKMRASKAHKPQGQLRDFLLELLKHLQTEVI